MKKGNQSNNNPTRFENKNYNTPETREKANNHDARSEKLTDKEQKNVWDY